MSGTRGHGTFYKAVDRYGDSYQVDPTTRRPVNYIEAIGWCLYMHGDEKEWQEMSLTSSMCSRFLMHGFGNLGSAILWGMGNVGRRGMRLVEFTGRPVASMRSGAGAGTSTKYGFRELEVVREISLAEAPKVCADEDKNRLWKIGLQFVNMADDPSINLVGRDFLNLGRPPVPPPSFIRRGFGHGYGRRY